MQINAHTNSHMHTYTCTYAYIHANTHTYMHIHAYTCTYVLNRSFYCMLEFLFVCVLHTNASTCSHACTHLLICIHTCTYMLKHAHIHTYMQIRIHTCIYMLKRSFIACYDFCWSAHCTHTSTCPLAQHMHAHTDMNAFTSNLTVL